MQTTSILAFALFVLSMPFAIQAQDYEKYINQANEQYMKGRYDVAESCYDLAGEFKPDDTFADSKSKDCRILLNAIQDYKDGKDDAALKTFGDYNTEASPQYYMGMIYKKQRNFTEALVWLDKSAQKDYHLSIVEIPVVNKLLDAQKEKEALEEKQRQLEAEKERAKSAVSEADRRAAQLQKEKIELEIKNQRARAEKRALEAQNAEKDAQIKRQEEELKVLRENDALQKELLYQSSDEDGDGVILAKDQCPDEMGEKITGCPKRSRFKVELLAGFLFPQYDIEKNGVDFMVRNRFDSESDDFADDINLKYQFGLRFDIFNPYSTLNLMWDVKYTKRGFIATPTTDLEEWEMQSIETPFYFKFHFPTTKTNADAPARKKKVNRVRAMVLVGGLAAYNFGEKYYNRTLGTEFDDEYMTRFNFGYTAGVGIEFAGKNGGVKLMGTYDQWIDGLFDEGSNARFDTRGFEYPNLTHYGLTLSFRPW